MATLRALATADLRELRSELQRGAFAAGLSRSTLAAVHLEPLWSALRPLSALGDGAVLCVLDAVLAERDARLGDDAHVVWTGPEGKTGWAEPTAAALQSIFRTAQREVLIAGYRFDHGADVLADLHGAMRERGVVVDVFLHVEPPPQGTDAPQYLRGQVGTFLLANWPKPPFPRIYIAPHALDWRAHVSLHAKCVVADERVALVGSANFTQRGQERNIEVGARITSARFAGNLVAHFRAAVSDGVFVEVTGRP
jgi:phosphatidylserine/phosphatidylglycerophosphate/cardiolipin synthase-like enzyme